MSVEITPDLDAVVDEHGDVVIPAGSVSRVIDVHPGDHVRVRIVGKRARRRNMYGVFSDSPINLDPSDLADLRAEMWRDLGLDLGE